MEAGTIDQQAIADDLARRKADTMEQPPKPKREPPKWGTRVRLTDPPAGIPVEGWKMGSCDACGSGTRAEPQPTRKLPNGVRVCGPCVLRRLKAKGNDAAA